MFTKKIQKGRICGVFFLSVISTIVALFARPKVSSAAVWDKIKTGLSVVGEVAYDVPATGEPYSPAVVAVNVINIVLSVLAIVFIIIIIYAGHLWMTAGGNSETISKAVKLIRNSIIGVLIIMAAYSITAFVFYYLTRASGGWLYFYR